MNVYDYLSFSAYCSCYLSIKFMTDCCPVNKCSHTNCESPDLLQSYHWSVGCFMDKCSFISLTAMSLWAYIDYFFFGRFITWPFCRPLQTFISDLSPVYIHDLVFPQSSPPNIWGLRKKGCIHTKIKLQEYGLYLLISGLLEEIICSVFYLEVV